MLVRVYVWNQILVTAKELNQNLENSYVENKNNNNEKNPEQRLIKK